MHRWENSFLQRIARVRAVESSLILAYNMTTAALMLSIGSVPVLVALATFATMAVISSDGASKTTPATFFVTLSLLNMMQYPLLAMPMSYALLQSSLVRCVGAGGVE